MDDNFRTIEGGKETSIDIGMLTQLQQSGI